VPNFDRLLPRGLPLPVLWLLALPLILGVAHLLQVIVEGPLNRFGHWLTRGVRRDAAVHVDALDATSLLRDA
jgi:hypothetical protein